MRFTVKSGGDFTVYDPGVYTAELVSYEDAGEGQFGKARVRLNWRLHDDDGAPYDELVPSWVSQVVAPNSTLYQVICALTGQAQLAEGADVELDDLIGKRCKVTLSREPKQNGSGETNKFKAYSPMRRPGATRPAPAASGSVPF